MGMAVFGVGLLLNSQFEFECVLRLHTDLKPPPPAGYLGPSLAYTGSLICVLECFEELLLIHLHLSICRPRTVILRGLPLCG